MSKEQEAYAQRTAQPTAQAPNVPPTSTSGGYVYPSQTGNTVMTCGGPGYAPQQPGTYPCSTNMVHRQLRQKSVLEAYMLWLVLGFLGAHHFYLRVRIYHLSQHGLIVQFGKNSEFCQLNSRGFNPHLGYTACGEFLVN